ncbi:hypothetical protein V6Z11_A09G137100 [Gossypium hirsutum]
MACKRSFLSNSGMQLVKNKLKRANLKDNH